MTGARDQRAAWPRTALRVADLSRSLAFYADLLGFDVARRDAERDLAWLDAAGYPVLLAGSAADDNLAVDVAPGHEVLPPGGTLHVLSVDLDNLRSRLAGAGLDIAPVERPWGDRLLRLTDPDGYRVSLELPARWTDEEAIRHYAAGARALEEAVDGLGGDELDARREPGGWTVRQIVHHLAAVEALTFPALLAALTEPGRVWRGNPWSPDRWAEALGDDRRPVEPALAQLQATRTVVLDLLERFRERWGWATREADGTPHPTVIALVGMLAGHALEHVAEIGAILAGQHRDR